jgi:hypothetical protein
VDNKKQFISNAQVHGHETRQSKDVHMLSHSTGLYNKSPFHAAIKIFNHLPANIKNSPSRGSFKNKLKAFLLVKSYYCVKDFLQEGPGKS